MQAQAYEGYFYNGYLHTADKKIKIPERKRVFLTVLEEPENQNTEDIENKSGLLDLFGKIQFAEGYDYKETRGRIS
jgi:hypothetical protein